jgi:hypothetical protein
MHFQLSLAAARCRDAGEVAVAARISGRPKSPAPKRHETDDNRVRNYLSSTSVPFA